MKEINTSQIDKENCENRTKKGNCLLVNKSCKKLTNNGVKYCLFYKNRDE